MIDSILPLVTLFLGYLLGFFTPWFKWQIDKKKDVRADRKTIIKSVRDYLDNTDSFDRVEFMKTILYGQVRPYLSNKLINEIENTPYNEVTILVSPSQGQEIWTPRDSLLNEIRKLEKRWGLI